MRYVVISKLAPGVDNSRQALGTFLKAGLSPGTEATYAGTDGKTFINIIETDAPDMVTSASYAPYFESVTVVPVVAVDGAWLEAVQAAQDNWG